MLIRKSEDLKWSDVTPQSLYLRRREFLATAAVPVLATTKVTRFSLFALPLTFSR